MTADDAERFAPEPGKGAGFPERSPYARDRARVLHSAALRRLAAKTQVVGVGVDDFPRTRLTHSLECAQIGRELGAALGCDPDVVDAACLAHDLGHPPFGHNGEDALDAAAAPCGGFEGNAQSLRVLTRLEAKVDGAGLNLTRAVLDAATKYPWPRRAGTRKFGVYADDLPVFEWLRSGAPEGRRCLETQVMDWADDVAYSVHDLEDGLYSGQIHLEALDSPAEREALVALTRERYSDAEPAYLAEVLDTMRAGAWWPRGFDHSKRALVELKRTTSEVIGRFCAAAHDATRRAAPPGPLRRYAADLAVPPAVRAECALLKGITARYVMDRDSMQLEHERQRRLVAELVEAVLAGAPGVLEPALRPGWDNAADDAARLRVVVDQVASLTDTSATAWHGRLVR